MNKKTYETPSVQTFEIALTQMLLAGSGDVTNVDGGGTGIGYGGGGNGGARASELDLDDF